MELTGANRSLTLRVAKLLKKKKFSKLVVLDLSLSSNRMNDVAHYQLLSEAIGNNPSLSYVNLSHSKLLGENVGHLSLVLKASEKLESLILDSNCIDSDGMDYGSHH